MYKILFAGGSFSQPTILVNWQLILLASASHMLLSAKSLGKVVGSPWEIDTISSILLIIWLN